MAIFRGVGGSGDSSDNSFLDAVTAQANAASASATSAANSLAAIQETEVTSASFNTSDGVLTLTKTGGATVTADLDGRFLTSYTETNDLSTAVTWANVPDANITQSSVTQHQAALSITENQISDLQSYLTTHQDISGKANLSGATFTGNVGVGSLGTSPTLQVYGNTSLFSGLSVTGNISVTGTVDGVDIAGLNTTVAGKADLSGDTFTGTITAPNVDISTTGSVTTNIATGGGGSGNTKVLNLATGYGTGGSTTVNICPTSSTTSRTINLNGNVEINGTLSDNNDNVYERTVRTRFQRRAYNSTTSLFTLTTTYTTLLSSLRIDSGVTTAVEHVLDLNINAIFNDINSSNEAILSVVATAPNPSSEDTINMGTVVASAFGQFTVAGDFTKHFSPYCGLSKNSDGSNAINFTNQQGWQYDPVTDRTTVYVYGYQNNIPTTGDTAYLHPFDWESAGTQLYGHDYPIEAYNALGITHQNQFHHIYLGYYKPSKTFTIRAKESTSSENVQINRIAGTYSQIIGN